MVLGDFTKGETMNTRRDVVVEVYSDDAKSELITEIPLTPHLGIASSDGVMHPASDEDLIQTAKAKFKDSDGRDPDTLHFQIKK